MREMTITILCDSCGNALGGDGTEPGTPIMFGSSGELTVDLCDECEGEIYGELKHILARGLRPQGRNGHRKPMAPRTKAECPRCGKRVTMGAGMTLHARKVHPEESEKALVEEARRQVQGAGVAT